MTNAEAQSAPKKAVDILHAAADLAYKDCGLDAGFDICLAAIEHLRGNRDPERSDSTVALYFSEWRVDSRRPNHFGKEINRTLDGSFSGKREGVFAKRWDEVNRPPLWLNGGIGALQHLLCSELRESVFGKDWQVVRELTQEEATAAATAIQWLGTSCGWCWLEETLKEMGYSVTYPKVSL